MPPSLTTPAQLPSIGHLESRCKPVPAIVGQRVLGSGVFHSRVRQLELSSLWWKWRPTAVLSGRSGERFPGWRDSEDGGFGQKDEEPGRTTVPKAQDVDQQGRAGLQPTP